MITLAPALAWGFWDRGLVREGMTADLNVFDAKTIGPAVPTVEYDLPGGGKRLLQKSTGFRATVVNGELTIENGRKGDPAAIVAGPEPGKQAVGIGVTCASRVRTRCGHRKSPARARLRPACRARR